MWLLFIAYNWRPTGRDILTLNPALATMQRHSQLTMASSIHRLSRPSRPPACTLPPIPESQSVFSVHYQAVASEPFDVVQIEYVDDDESSLGSLESCCCSECERVIDVDDELLFSVVSPRAPTPDESDDPSESADSHISTRPIIPRTSETEQIRKKKTPLSFLRSFRALSPEFSFRDPKAGSKGQSTDADLEGTVNKSKGIFRILKSRLHLNSRETASLNNVADDDSKSESGNRSPRAGVFSRLHSF
ncbi:hypothetical protein EV421DRAFT_339012 [Armillaria borealis]|uniref:Uncharacterized protein n=1 Tax=Armillaria borealis TaxID=47425 RepID=A0AA39MTD5_9AGAR|nr:hypothetical protein EV421DRAFT_339012 [Armillaria borealis]